MSTDYMFLSLQKKKKVLGSGRPKRPKPPISRPAFGLTANPQFVEVG